LNKASAGLQAAGGEAVKAFSCFVGVHLEASEGHWLTDVGQEGDKGLYLTEAAREDYFVSARGAQDHGYV